MSCSERLAVLLAALLVGGGAQAALDEPAQSLEAEAARLGATHRLDAGTRVHLLQWRDGSQVRQYEGSDGRVYALAWNSRGKPPLARLLGRHYDSYAAAARRSLQRRPGVHHRGSWREGDLVVESVANANAFVGRAYLVSKTPAGQGGDAIR